MNRGICIQQKKDKAFHIRGKKASLPFKESFIPTQLYSLRSANISIPLRADRVLEETTDIIP